MPDNKLEMMPLNLEQVSSITGVDEVQLGTWIETKGLFQGLESLDDPRYMFTSLYEVHSICVGEGAQSKARTLPKSYIDNGEALLASYVGSVAARKARDEYDAEMKDLLQQGHVK